MKVHYQSFNLKFRHPFTISRGTKTHQPIFVAILEHFGINGYGEAPAIAYYHIPVEQMITDLEAKRQVLEKFALTEPDRCWHFLHHLFPNNSFLVCALDIAVWDIFGKMNGEPLYKLWHGDSTKNPITDYTIGIDTPEKMLAKLHEKPWPIYKVKVGTAEDVAIIKLLREHTDATFRVDANAAWDLETALKIIPQLKEYGVEFVEQPLAKDDWEGMKVLYKKSVLPLYADESCVVMEDVARCHNHFHGINIKLTKCGGITPALTMIKDARNLGMTVMAGSMNESTIGTAAVAHLLPFLDHVDMDGPLLLEEDIATGISFTNGKIGYSGHAGLGIEFTGVYQKSLNS